MKLFQIIVGLGLVWSSAAKTTRKSKQKDFAFKMYKAQGGFSNDLLLLRALMVSELLSSDWPR